MLNSLFNVAPQIQPVSVQQSFVEPQLRANAMSALMDVLGNSPAGILNQPTATPGNGYDITPTNGLVSQIEPVNVGASFSLPPQGADGRRGYSLGPETPASDVVRMNANGTRRRPLSDRLSQTLESTLGPMGLSFEVFSAGQAPLGSDGPRTGSTRHDHGNAADGYFYQGDRRLNWANPNDRPLIQEAVYRLRQAGLTGFGAGPGYMPEGSLHIGYGNAATWGAGGRGANAPQWLRDATSGNRTWGDQVAAAFTG